MVEKVVSLGCSSDTNQSDLQLHLARITSRGTEGLAAPITPPPLHLPARRSAVCGGEGKDKAVRFF